MPRGVKVVVWIWKLVGGDIQPDEEREVPDCEDTDEEIVPDSVNLQTLRDDFVLCIQHAISTGVWSFNGARRPDI